MKPSSFPAILLCIMLLSPLFASGATAADPSDLEKEAVVLMYDTAVKISEYADNTDPMSSGKFSKESLDIKVSFYELALEALKDIADEPDYRASPKNLPFASTYNKAVLAKSRIEGKIKELRDLQTKYDNGEIHEDGEIDGSGLLWDDKYDNNKYNAKLIEVGKEDTSENKKREGIFGSGISWWWMIIVIALVSGIVFRKKIRKGGIKDLREATDFMKNKLMRNNEEMKRVDLELQDLLKEIRQTIQRILEEIEQWAGKENHKEISGIIDKIKDRTTESVSELEIDEWIRKYLPANFVKKDEMRTHLLQLNDLLKRANKVYYEKREKKKKELLESLKEEAKKKIKKIKEESKKGNYDIKFLQEIAKVDRFDDIIRLFEQHAFDKAGRGGMDTLSEQELERLRKAEKKFGKLLEMFDSMFVAAIKEGMNLESMRKVLDYIWQYKEGGITKAEELLRIIKESDEGVRKLFKSLMSEIEVLGREVFTVELLYTVIQNSLVAEEEGEKEEHLEELMKLFNEDSKKVVVPLETNDIRTAKKIIEVPVKIMGTGKENGRYYVKLSVDESYAALKIRIEENEGNEEKLFKKMTERLRCFIRACYDINKGEISVSVLRKLVEILKEKDQDIGTLEKELNEKKPKVTIKSSDLGSLDEEINEEHLKGGESAEWTIKSYDENLGEVMFDEFFLPLKIGGSDDEFKSSIKALLALRHFRKSAEVTKEEFLWSLRVHHAYNQLRELNNTEKIVKRIRNLEVERNGRKKTIRSEKKIKAKITETDDELGTVTLNIDGFLMNIVLALDENKYGKLIYRPPRKEPAPPEQSEERTGEEEEEEESRRITLNRLNSYLLDIVIIAINDYKHPKGIHLRVVMAVTNALKAYPLTRNIAAFKEGIEGKNIIIPGNILKKYGVSEKGNDAVLKVKEYDFETNILKFENMRKVLALSSGMSIADSLKSVIIESEVVLKKKLEIEKIISYLEDAAKEGELPVDAPKLVGKEMFVDADNSLEIERASVESVKGLGDVVKIKFKDCNIEVRILPDRRRREINKGVLKVTAYSEKELEKGFISVSLFLRMYEIFRSTTQDMGNLGSSLKGKKLKVRIRDTVRQFVMRDVDCENGEMRLEEVKGGKSGVCRFKDRNVFMRDLLTLAGFSTGIVTPESLVEFVNSVLKRGGAGNLEKEVKRISGFAVTTRDKRSYARIVDVKVENGVNILVSIDKFPPQVWVRISLPELKLALQIVSAAAVEGADLTELEEKIKAFGKKENLHEDPWKFFIEKAAEKSIETYGGEAWRTTFGGKALSMSEMEIFKSLAKGIFVLKK